MTAIVPAIDELVKAVQAQPEFIRSLTFLLNNRKDLEEFSGAEHFATSLALSKRTDLAEFNNVEPIVRELADGRKNLEGHHHHFIQVRAAILRELWPREIFIGLSVIDELLFEAIRDRSITEPVRHVLEFVHDRGLHHAGFIVYPVHSLGVLGAGLLAVFQKSDFTFFNKDYGLFIHPQTNDFSKTLSFLERIRQDFGVAQALPRETIKHWELSRGLKWLSSNPLLILRTQSFPGNYYENQSLLIDKLKFATSFIFLVAALEYPRSKQDTARLASSAMVNNWQTMDLHHYLVFYTRPHGKELSGDCVPIMNHRQPELVELTDINVELNPKYWAQQVELLERVTAAMKRVQAGYFQVQFNSEQGSNSVPARVFAKLFHALTYFRRSFRRTGSTDEAAINLGAAFELLLTDNYSRGVDDRLKRRLGLALRTFMDADGMLASVDKLYEARSEAIHSGNSNVKVDLEAAQRTFACAFLGVVAQLDKLPAVSSQPIADILGDVRETPKRSAGPFKKAFSAIGESVDGMIVAICEAWPFGRK